MYVHFSPMQNKSGLLVYHHAGLTLNLLVLPKMWRPEGKLPNPWKYEKDILNVIAYEGERHHVKLPEDATPDIKKRWERWKALLENCCGTLSSKANVEDSENDLLDKDTLKSLCGLISTISTPPSSSLTDFEENNQTLTSNEVWKAQLENLFKLALFSSTRNQFDINIFQSNDQQVVALTDDATIQEDSPIFRMLAIENFLSEIETHLHKIHQGYVQTTEHLDSIRGSVTGTSLMMLDAGASLKPKCRYNKFVPDIPLYQVFVTTLDAISRGWCLPCDPLIRHLDIVQATQKKAARIRTQLQHITSLPLEIARNTCQRVYLNRLQRFWKPSLNLSKILLRNKPVFIDDSVSGSGGYMWMVSTATVWESILEQSLETQWKGHIHTHVKNHPSWDGRGSQPDSDLVAKFDRCLFIFDAKYKMNGRNEKTPTKAEEYQMFAYSHLLPAHKNKSFLRSDIDGIHLGLVYPTFTPQSYPKNRYTENTQNTFRRGSYDHHSDAHCTLSIYYIAFPSTDDVVNLKKWNEKMKEIAIQWTGAESDNNTKPFAQKWYNKQSE